MKGKIYLILAFLFCSIAFISCSKDDDDNSEVKHLEVSYTAPTYKTYDTPSVEFFSNMDDAYGCLVISEKMRNVFYNAQLDGKISRDESYAMACMLDYMQEHSQVADMKVQTRFIGFGTATAITLLGVGIFSTFKDCSGKIAENNITKLDRALKERGCGLDAWNMSANAERRKYYDILKKNAPDLVRPFENEVNPSNAFWSAVVERRADNATNRIVDILFDDRLGNQSLIWADSYQESNIITYTNMAKVTHDMAETGKDVIMAPVTIPIGAVGAGMNVANTINAIGDVKNDPSSDNKGQLIKALAQNALDFLHLGKEVGFDFPDAGEYNNLLDWVANKEVENMVDYYKDKMAAAKESAKSYTGSLIIAETDDAYYVSNNGKIQIPSGETVKITRANEDGSMDVITTTVDKDTSLDELLTPKEEESDSDDGFAKIACGGEWHVYSVYEDGEEIFEDGSVIVYFKFNENGTIKITEYWTEDDSTEYMTWKWVDLGGGKLRITVVEDGNSQSVDAKYSFDGTVLKITYTSGPAKGGYMKMVKI